jgi:peptidoglycan/LPS O-acetylase OafA/YrhL
MMWSGVDLFFVLSGFLIGGILIDNRQAKNYFRVFYTRRAFRILPIYMATVAVGFALAYFGLQYPAQTGQLIPAPWYLSFTQNFWMASNDRSDLWLPHSWSLAVEEQFYLLMPALLFFLPRDKIAPIAIGLTIAAPLIRLINLLIYGAESFIANYVLFPMRMDALLWGVVVAYGFRVEAIKEYAKRNPAILYGALAVLLLFPATATVTGWGQRSAFMTVIGFSGLGALYACTLAIVVTSERGPLTWITKLRSLRLLGIGSYSIYLTHTLIPFYVLTAFGASHVNVSNLGDWLLFGASVALVFVVAWAS